MRLRYCRVELKRSESATALPPSTAMPVMLSSRIESCAGEGSGGAPGGAGAGMHARGAGPREVEVRAGSSGACVILDQMVVMRAQRHKGLPPGHVQGYVPIHEGPYGRAADPPEVEAEEHLVVPQGTRQRFANLHSQRVATAVQVESAQPARCPQGESAREQQGQGGPHMGREGERMPRNINRPAPPSPPPAHFTMTPALQGQALCTRRSGRVMRLPRTRG